MDVAASFPDLVEYMARGLVDHPDEVEVEQFEEQGTSVIELRVAQEDLGKVIGKQGRTVKAMRTILAAASAKQGKRSDLEILE
ncbi:MAG: KH domain-containing protein [Myxococcota bacterium]